MANLFRLAQDIYALGKGLWVFNRTGEAPGYGYHSMVRFFCRTGGLSNDLFHQCVRLSQPRYVFPTGGGVLGEEGGLGLGEAVRQLDEQGYYVFSARLPEASCDALIAFTEKAEGYLLPRRDAQPSRVKLDRAHPQSHACAFYEQDLHRDEGARAIVQGLICDPSILRVAQAYLGCAPILDYVHLLWSNAYSKSPYHAQIYHFDLDRFRWLKFFFYLNDVSPENGPHCYVAGTHKSLRKPRVLLERGGFARFTDEELGRYYPAESFAELCGPRGTIIAVDTGGFHKGKPLIRGERFLFELEFCDSLFGNTFESIYLDAGLLPELEDALVRFPRVYRRYRGP